MNTIILIQSQNETQSDFIDRVEQKEHEVHHLFTTMSKGRAEINYVSD